MLCRDAANLLDYLGFCALGVWDSDLRAVVADLESCPVIVLVSGATSYLRSESVGHLIVPKQWNDPRTLDLQPGKWAMDNGAFSGFDHGAFMRMLEAYAPYDGCLFVTAPDVVADAAATLSLWPFWSQLIRGIGRRSAFVAQDGLEINRVPWKHLSDDRGVLFIGGSTKFKESPFVRSLCGIAKAKGIWVHWGRVNSKRRYEMALMSGADSIDGTGFSMFPDTCIPKVEQWDKEIRSQRVLEM